MIRVVGESVKACHEVCCRLLFFSACDISSSFRCFKYCLDHYNQSYLYQKQSNIYHVPVTGTPKHMDMDAGTQHEFPYVIASGKQWSAKSKVLLEVVLPMYVH